MNYKNFGALPTAEKKLLNSSTRAVRLQLFYHYLNHKRNSSNTVLENIVISFNKKYRPERYYFKSSLNKGSADDSLNDIRSVAHLIVWEATDKYLWGFNNKTNIPLKEKFNFCIFASEQVKFGLKTHLRLLNTNRICGKLPDSDSTRKIYSKIPKIKLDKKPCKKGVYKTILKETDVSINEIKLVDEFLSAKTEYICKESKPIIVLPSTTKTIKKIKRQRVMSFTQIRNTVLNNY